MALSAFDDPASAPDPEAVEAVLGAAAASWRGLIADVHALVPGLAETWAFGGARYGWTLRLVDGKRVILHLTPQAGAVLVGVALGEKAVAAARAAAMVSHRTLALVDGAPRYAEGRGVRFELTGAEDLDVARELAWIKLAR